MKEDKTPETQENIIVTCAIPDGKKVSKAWILTPDREPEVIYPAISISGNTVTIPVQELSWWDIVIIDFN